MKLALALLALSGCTDRAILIGDWDGMAALPDAGPTTTELPLVAPSPSSSPEAADSCAANNVDWFVQSARAESQSVDNNMVAVGDFNNDGKLDLATPLAVYLGNGDGTLRGAQPYWGAPGGKVSTVVVAGDFDGDGKLDLFTGCDNGTGVDAALGNGDGTFRAPAPCDKPVFFDLALAADLDGDGNLDIVTHRCDQVDDGACSWNIYALSGNGDGSFRVSPPRPGSLVAVGDFNHDGKADIFAWCATAGTGIALGRGDGTFAGQGCSLQLESAAVVADFDHDGALDLAAVSAKEFDGDWAPVDAVTVYRGSGGGALAQNQVSCVGSTPLALASGDFDGDGKLDVVTTTRSGLSLLLGRGDGSFQPALGVLTDDPPWPVASGDFNGDGKPDLALGFEGGVSIWLNRH